MSAYYLKWILTFKEHAFSTYRGNAEKLSPYPPLKPSGNT